MFCSLPAISASTSSVKTGRSRGSGPWREMTSRGGLGHEEVSSATLGRTWEVMRHGNPIDRYSVVGAGDTLVGAVAARWPFTCSLRSRTPPAGWGPHDEKNADRQHLLAVGADHVETTVLDTQRTLALVGLTLGAPLPNRYRCRLWRSCHGPALRRPPRSRAPTLIYGARPSESLWESE